MEQTYVVSTIEEGEIAARKIIGLLEGNACDVVSFHTAYLSDLTILENAYLGEKKLSISKGLVKIPLCPRRSICFDIKEKPQITFVSERRIDIVRVLSRRDTVTRIILINKTANRGEAS